MRKKKLLYRLCLFTLSGLFLCQFSLHAQFCEISLITPTEEVVKDSSFTVNLVLNSPKTEIAAYGFDFNYDPAVLAAACDNGGACAEAGADGFFTVANSQPGVLKTTGFALYGKGPAYGMDFLHLNFTALAGGVSPLSVTVRDLVDASSNPIDSIPVNELEITVVDYLVGDVNGDMVVDIVDALMIAQYTVGLDPPGFNAAAADMRRDGVINILDALAVARFYVNPVKKASYMSSGSECIGAPVLKCSDISVSARLTDESGNPLAGKPVTWTTLSSNSLELSGMSETNASGYVTRSIRGSGSSSIPPFDIFLYGKASFAGDEEYLASMTTFCIEVTCPGQDPPGPELPLY